MIYEEYRTAIHELAKLSKKLTLKLDEERQDLFEKYSELYAEVAIYEANVKLNEKDSDT